MLTGQIVQVPAAEVVVVRPQRAAVDESLLIHALTAGGTDGGRHRRRVAAGGLRQGDGGRDRVA